MILGTKRIINIINQAKKMNSSDLCIPKMNINIPKTYVVEILSKADLGKIERMTELPLKQNPLYKRVLFTITWNVNNPKVEYWKTRIMKQQPLKLIPTKTIPYYWIITASCCPTK